MNSRSLVLAAVALLVGIGIGIFLQEDPPAPERTNPSVRHSDTDDESTHEWAANSKASSPTAARREEARASGASVVTNPARGDAATPQVELSPRGSRPREPRQEPVYHDGASGPDEPGLPFPRFVDQDEAAADFEQYGDGPVSTGRPEAEDRGATGSRPWEGSGGESEAEGCLPLFSSCRRDSDCCGASVCRSRPGTISGSFECTAD